MNVPSEKNEAAVALGKLSWLKKPEIQKSSEYMKKIASLPRPSRKKKPIDKTSERMLSLRHK